MDESSLLQLQKEITELEQLLSEKKHFLEEAQLKETSLEPILDIMEINYR